MKKPWVFTRVPYMNIQLLALWGSRDKVSESALYMAGEKKKRSTQCYLLPGFRITSPSLKTQVISKTWPKT